LICQYTPMRPHDITALSSVNTTKTPNISHNLWDNNTKKYERKYCTLKFQHVRIIYPGVSCMVWFGITEVAYIHTESHFSFWFLAQKAKRQSEGIKLELYIQDSSVFSFRSTYILLNLDLFALLFYKNFKVSVITLYNCHTWSFHLHSTYSNCFRKCVWM
jgi:hypothetical protein